MITHDYSPSKMVHQTTVDVLDEVGHYVRVRGVLWYGQTDEVTFRNSTQAQRPKSLVPFNVG